MIDYILVVSTPVKDPHGHYIDSAGDRHDRLNIINSIRQRTVSMPVLDREAIPILPHLLDIPRHLAVVASAVIRNSRDYQARVNSSEHGDKLLDEFCNKCFQVEEHALRRVSQLASRRRRSSIPSSSNEGHRESSHSPTSPIPVPGNSTRTTGLQQRRTARKSSRPSTAPSSSDPELSHSRELRSMGSMPSSPVTTTIDSLPRLFTPVSSPRVLGGHPSSPESREQGIWSRRGQRLLHLKSTSTDGISVISSNAADSSKSSMMDDTTEDSAKTKKGLLRGILTRR